MIARPNALDRFVGYFAPGVALRRMSARASLQQIEAFGNAGIGGYEAGKLNRLNRGHLASMVNENGIPREAVQRMRWASWDLWRNNPDCRKVCRTIDAKVIGKGPHPQSQATDENGDAWTDFRQRAREVFHSWSTAPDYRGLPGFGGQTFVQLAKVALRGAILGGDTLFRFRAAKPRDWRANRTIVPTRLQLLRADRLAEYTVITAESGITPGNYVFRGIEVNQEGIRQKYWILKAEPGDPLQTILSFNADAVPASEIGHLYAAEDVDQLRGTPWFASALMQTRDVADYQYNELKSSAIASCVVAGYTRATGQKTMFLEQPADAPLADADGNPIVALQPGMFLDLGRDGKIEGFSPNRPTTDAVAFITALIRRVANAFPGVKGSTLTGDYKGATYSSERAADNDAWPELYGVQNWFYYDFLDPIFKHVITVAVEMGYFDDLLSPSEFASRRGELLPCHWQGPVPLSINPTDDAEGAAARVKQGTSNLQRECAKLGVDWQEVMRETAEVQQYALELGLPPDLVRQFIGQEPVVEQAEVESGGDSEPGADSESDADGDQSNAGNSDQSNAGNSPAPAKTTKRPSKKRGRATQAA